MARYESKEICDDFTVTWTTREPDEPFQLHDMKAGMYLNLTPSEAKELALFLVTYLLEYVE